MTEGGRKMAREMGRSKAVQGMLQRVVSSWSAPAGLMRTMSAESNSSAVASEESSSVVVSSVQQLSGSSSKGTLGKRFYKKAIVSPADPEGSGFQVSLDHRVLRTPAKKPLKFSNPALAHAIAAEWEWQDRNGVRSFTMPLMKLAAISIDQVPNDKERIIATLLKYCHTDALCCRASPGSVLHDKQSKMWDPLLDWAEAEMGARPDVTTSIFGLEQPQHYLDSVDRSLRKLNHWELAAIDSLAGSARSLIVAFAIARNRINIEEAIEIIRVEENHQVEDWGFVEGGHDIDEADILVRISAASVFLRLL